MKTIHAVYENGVFRPTTPVDLPEGFEVTIKLSSSPTEWGLPARFDENGMEAIYEILSHRYDGGEPDLAERHNEHQP